MECTALISAVCSLFSLITIIILVIERFERKRPYLQATFELLRDNLVCIKISNVGETPAMLKSIKFDEKFISQLPEFGQIHARDRNNLNISIYPNQHWVISFDVMISTVLKYENTHCEIFLKYVAKGKIKKYKEVETVEFNDYSGFLVYISETDELRKTIKDLGKNLEEVNKNLTKISNQTISSIQTENCETLEDELVKTIITSKNKEPVIIQKTEDNTNGN